MADNIIQNTLASGELSPHLYGRTDLAKYHSGCMLAKNMFVDYRGGLSSRPGTQFIGLTPGNVPAHLQKFVFSSSQTYILVFTDHALAFIRNPLTPGHINGSNAGYILAGGGGIYTIATPYAGNDLQLLKFSQSADVMIITHPSYAPGQLTRHDDTNWTLTAVPIGTTTTAPSGLTVSITGLPTGSTDPQNTNYSYVVTAVGQDGQESQPSTPEGITGINIAATQGTVTLNWNQIVNAQFYNVYKAVPSPGGVLVPVTSTHGFIGIAYGTTFTDSNIIADFSQLPPQHNNPLLNGRVLGVNIASQGSGYPVGDATSASISDPNGASAEIIPVISGNVAGSTGSVIGFYIKNAGNDIANGAAVIVTGGGGSGFAGTVNTSATTGAEPAVSAYFQQRRVYAGSNSFPLTLNGSRTAYYNNFDVSNPPVDSDAYQFTLSLQEINAIKWLVSMPGGLVIFTDGGILQLTGGSLGISNPAAVTPSNAVVVPQSFYGAADIHPIVINYDILYVQSTGSIIRDLSYNFFVNIYTGTDLTMLSSHLFAPRQIVDWAYQDAPYKIIWAQRDDGDLLSLTFLKEQDVSGWTQHSTHGLIFNVETVREGMSDALYMVVFRNGTNYCIERLAGNTLFDASDAWCLDAALFTPPFFQAAYVQPGAGADVVGATNVRFTTNVPAFTSVYASQNNMLRGYGTTGRAIITGFIDSENVTATILAPFPLDPTQQYPRILPPNEWNTIGFLTTVTGLSHLEGMAVYALVDGVPQGPFTVSGGAINLTSGGYDVLVGLQFISQFQQLPILPGGGITTEGKRHRDVATTIRIMNAGTGLQIGTSFQTLKPFRPGLSSTDTAWNTPYQPPRLFTGDIHMHLDAKFRTQGGICVQMSDPLPFTILSVIDEVEGLRP